MSPERRRRIWLVVLLGALVAAPFALYLFAYSAIVRTRLVLWLIDRARSDYRIDLTIGEVEYDLRTLSIRLRDVAAASTAHRDTPFFTARDVALDLPWGIVRRRGGDFEIDSLRLVAPVVHVHRFADGTLNLPPSRDAKSSPPVMRFKAFGVEGLDFAFVDETQRLRIETHGVSFRMTEGGTQRIEGSLTTARGPELRFGERELSATRFSGIVGFDGRALDFHAFEVAVPQMRVTIDGRIDRLLTAPAIDARVTGAVDVRAAAAFALPKTSGVDVLRATADLTGRVSGDLVSPVANLTLRSRTLRWRDQVVDDIEIQTRVSANELLVERARGRFGAASIQARGAWNFDSGERRMTANWRQIDAAAIRRFAPSVPVHLAAVVDGDLELSADGFALGNVDATVGARTRSNANAAGVPADGSILLQLHRGAWLLQQEHRLGQATEVRSRLQGRVAARMGDSTLLGPVTVRTTDAAATVALLKQAGVTLPGFASDLRGNASATLQASGTVDAPRVNGPFEATLTDLARLAPQAKPSGSLSAKGTIAGPVMSPVITADVAGRVSIAGVDLDRVSGRAEIENRRARLSVAAPRFGATADGVVTLTAPFEFSARATAPRLDLTTLPVEWFGNRRVLGTVDVSGGAAGSLDALETVRGSIDLAPTQVSFDGTDVRLESPAHIEYSDKGIASNEIELRSHDVDVRARLDEAGIVHVVNGRAEWRGAVATATGTIPVRTFDEYLPDIIKARLKAGTTTALLDIQVEKITPAVLGGVLPDQAQKSVVGGATATARIETGGAGINRLTGWVDVDTQPWTIEGIQFAAIRPPRFTIANGRLVAEAFEWRMVERPENTVALTGGLELDPLRLDARVTGKTDLRLATAFFPSLSTFGDGTLDVTVTGEPSSPHVGGTIQVTNAGLTIPDPAVAVTDVHGTLVLADTTVTARDIEGRANGGTLSARGTLDYAAGAGSLTLDARGVGLDFPAGLESEADADLTLRYERSRPQLGGRVSVTRGEYRRPLSLVTELLARTRRQPSSSTPQAASALDSLGLDVRIVTDSDIQVDNNYGRFDIGGDLRVVGSLSRPGFIGRAEIREGGQLFLGGISYQIDRGGIDFSDPSQIVPDLNIAARARVAAHDITLNISGPPDRLTTDLTADDPSLGKADIISLLLTGRPYSEATKQQAAQSGQQLLGLLSGEVLGAAGRFVGLDTLRFERGVTSDLGDLSDIAGETDPSARLTLAKNLSPEVRLLLSHNLAKSGGLTWIAGYQPRPTVDIRVVSRENRDRAYEIRHQVSLGAPANASPPRTTPPQPRVGAVRLRGEPGFSDADLLPILHLKTGDRFDFREWREDRDRLASYYRDRGYLEARIVPRRSTTPDGYVALDYDLRRGATTELHVAGGGLTAPAIDAIRSAWSHAVFDRFLETEAARLARIDQVQQGFLEARTRATIDRREPDVRRLTIALEPGPHTANPTIAFEGNRYFSTRDLEARFAAADMTFVPWLDPAAARQFVLDLYRASGFLSARVNVDGSRIAVEEGPRYRIRDVRLEGVAPLRQEEIRKAAALPNDRAYAPQGVDEAAQRVDAWFKRHGFNEASVTSSTSADATHATVDVRLQIVEGPQQLLSRVDIEGLTYTTHDVAERTLHLEPGKPADLTEWQAARKRLYETGVFQRVEVEKVDLPPEGGSHEASVAARVTVEERPRWRLRYGFQLEDEARPASEARDLSGGIVAEVLDRNLFGRAASAGSTFRYDRREKLGRVFLTTPQLFGRRATTSVFVTRSRQARGDGIPILIDKSSLTAEQRIKPAGRLNITYGYSLEQNHTFNPNADPNDPLALDFTVRIARLTGTSVIDTRDDPFDTRRGLFHSSSVEYAAGGVGSDLRFIKYLAQQTYFHPVNRVVLASSARLGLARGIDQDLIGSEQFFAGGANSIRGYDNEAIAGRDILDQPIGGSAMIVLNQEVRFPLYKWFGGVGFVDAGNVFPSIRAVDLFDLKVGAGAGLRVNTPYALVRVDFARGRWYFSIGQIF